MLNIIETLNTIYQMIGIGIIILIIFHVIFTRKSLKNNLIRNIKIRIAICIILSVMYLIYISASIMLEKPMSLIAIDIITMLIWEINIDTAIKDLKILKKRLECEEKNNYQYGNRENKKLGFEER